MSNAPILSGDVPVPTSFSHYVACRLPVVSGILRLFPDILT